MRLRHEWDDAKSETRTCTRCGLRFGFATLPSPRGAVHRPLAVTVAGIVHLGVAPARLACRKSRRMRGARPGAMQEGATMAARAARRAAILDALAATRGDVPRAAGRLGVERANLYRAARHVGLDLAGEARRRRGR